MSGEEDVKEEEEEEERKEKGKERRGRPLGRWKDKVKEYVSEKGVRGNGLEWARQRQQLEWTSTC